MLNSEHFIVIFIIFVVFVFLLIREAELVSQHLFIARFTHFSFLRFSYRLFILFLIGIKKIFNFAINDFFFSRFPLLYA